mgnify:CR=1 FL=1
MESDRTRQILNMIGTQTTGSSYCRSATRPSVLGMTLPPETQKEQTESVLHLYSMTMMVRSGAMDLRDRLVQVLGALR